MKPLKVYWQDNSRVIGWTLLAVLALCLLLLYKLGSLSGGLSQAELMTSNAVIGWHGMFNDPLFLPIKIVRSAVVSLDPTFGQTITRIPNALFGAATIAAFGYLIWLWHGWRTTLFATALFAASSWTLHVSRYASFDILYLWGIVTLLLAHTLLNRYKEQPRVWFSVLAFWGICLTIPGLQWFVIAEIFLQKKALKEGWKYCVLWWQKVLSVIVFILWLPLIFIDFTRPGQLAAWIGLPHHLASPTSLLKQFVAVFVHLFIRGPQYPTIWLGRSPILDAFTLAMSVLGIYFYATKWNSTRARLLGIFFSIGVIEVSLQGQVVLSVIVPILYACAAMGIAYIVHEWLQVFPRNPLARTLGIGLVSFVVFVSCVYNLRSYFIAWPHSPVTQTTFRYHR